MQNATIIPIPKESVNKICCGQVVVTLAVAVKELIENSLDAGATKIDIKFKEHGSDLIEVIDNGSGILQEDFENITRMHTTSKLSQFEDLSSVSTFGFRGEALGSLCQLGKVSIHTYNTVDLSGTYIAFDSAGEILTRENRARQPGTTVWVSQIFSRLHVRRVELMRNIKREFSRAVQILTGYCLVCGSTKITCYKIDAKGAKHVILNNDYGAKLSQNIAIVFGPQQLSSLKEIPSIDSIPDDILEEFRLGREIIDPTSVQIEGLISSCLPGHGRSSTDRQYLYVNNRPCDIPRLATMINSIYKQYNRTQYPVFVIKIGLPIDSVDVNLAPDKRQIFLAHEKLVSACVKTSLLQLFDSQNISGCHLQQMTLIRSQSQADRTTTISPTKQSLTQFRGDSSPSPFSSEGTNSISSPSNLSSLKRFSSSVSNGTKNICQSSPTQIKRRKTNNLPETRISNIKSFFLQNESESRLNEETPFDKDSATSSIPTSEPDVQEALDPVCESASPVSEVTKYQVVDLTLEIMKTTSPSDSQYSESESWKTSQSSAELQGFADQRVLKDGSHSLDKQSQISSEVSSSQLGQSPVVQYQSPPEDMADSNTPCDELIEKPVSSVTIQFSLLSIRNKLAAHKKRALENGGSLCDINFDKHFKAKINPDENDKAEEELRTIFKKDNFQKLSIVGQFNRGFILCVLERNLFIIDQHASDEKYNFERLHKGLQMNIQKLVIPKPLRLTVTQEEVVIDNMDVFKNNGFDFILDDSANLGNRLKLVSIPTNRNYTFGKEDIEEMIFVLSESGSRECKPSRIRQMLATQACRMSIMIGTALTKSEMKKVVHHMSEMDQPWNCPHGRPTIRHVLNLNMLTNIKCDQVD